jgi:hypothetical protein
LCRVVRSGSVALRCNQNALSENHLPEIGANQVIVETPRGHRYREPIDRKL